MESIQFCIVNDVFVYSAQSAIASMFTPKVFASHVMICSYAKKNPVSLWPCG